MNLKASLKRFIYSSRPLRRIFILWHQANGSKPWRLGYSVHKFNLISRVICEHLEYFRSQKLPSGYGFGFDERVVEYPWFFSRLKESENVLLDAGSTLNHTDILSAKPLQGRDLYISTLFPEGRPKATVNPTYIYEDIREMGYKDGTFDAVACLSTLEHVGMDNAFIYTPDPNKKENDKEGYLTAVRELKRVLKPGGTLYLTMPYGKHRDLEWFQIFDAGMVKRVKEAFGPSKVEETYFKYENEQWNYSNAESCRDSVYFDIHHEKVLRSDHLAASESVVCLEVTKS